MLFLHVNEIIYADDLFLIYRAKPGNALITKDYLRGMRLVKTLRFLRIE